MRKKMLSVMSLVLILSFLVCGTANAADMEPRMVDGSYLTMQEKSTGYSPRRLQRGEYLADGESIISKAGKDRIYVYGQTTANTTVNYLAVIVYVEEYNEEADRWQQIDAWAETANNTYYVSTGKTVNVDGGHYYRVSCAHMAGNQQPYDETISATDGIWID